MKALRAAVPAPGTDRFLAPDLAAAEHLLASGRLLTAVQQAIGELAMSAAEPGPRPVPRPARHHLSCRAWPQEAALRMLMNNLDPDVAENPDELVVYGGTGRAARSWAASTRSCATLRTLGDDETLLVQIGQAGRRLRHPRVGPARADRQLQPRPRLGDLGGVPPPGGARPDDVRPDDRRLVDLHRHARASCRAPTSRFAEIARRSTTAASLAGTITLTAGLGGMGGAQPLAITHQRRRRLCASRSTPQRIERRLDTRYLDEVADIAGRRAGARSRPSAERRGAVDRPVGNAAEVLPELLARGLRADIVTDQT